MEDTEPVFGLPLRFTELNLCAHELEDPKKEPSTTSSGLVLEFCGSQSGMPLN